MFLISHWQKNPDLIRHRIWPGVQIQWLNTWVSDNLGNANVKKENGCEEISIYKVFKWITNNHDFLLTHQQTNTTDFQENCPGVKGYQWKKILLINHCANCFTNLNIKRLLKNRLQILLLLLSKFKQINNFHSPWIFPG